MLHSLVDSARYGILKKEIKKVGNYLEDIIKNTYLCTAF